MTTPPEILPENPEHNVPALRDRAPESLVALAGLYFQTQVLGQSEHTVDAKRRDLARFLTFYGALFGHDRPAEWFPSVTREFLKTLGRDKDLAPATVHRIYATVRHFAGWAHKTLAPFPMGAPTDGVRPPEEPEGDFQGLSRKDQIRLLAAADSLRGRRQRGTATATRDRAVVHALLASALRVSELLALDRDQFDGRVFLNVRQKGGARRRRVPLNREARQALADWLAERGDAAGPLFSTRTGRRLTRARVYEALKRMEAQANAHLPAAERFTVTPHTLRHTRLRRAAEERGLQYARKLSGHKSDKYIWRYIQPAEDDFEAAMDALD